MGVWELEAAIALVLFALAVPILVIPVVHHLYRTYGRIAGWPAVLSGLGGLYGLALVAFTQFPIPADSADACARTTGGWRPRPFASFVESADTAVAVGLTTYLTSASFLQEAMNILLFVPLGVMVGLRGKRPWWSAALAGLAVSAAIEATQGTGIWGTYDCPYRLAEFDDLITNTTGAVIGWPIGRWASRWMAWPKPAGAPTTGSLTVGRRVTGAGCDLLAMVLVGIACQVVAAATVRLVAGEVDPTGWPTAWTWLLSSLLPVVLVSLVGPLTRSDRASVGQWAVLARPIDQTGAPPSIRQLAVRAAVRWAPYCVAGLTPLGPLVLLGGVAIQVSVVVMRTDRASLAALASGVRVAARAAPSPAREDRVGPGR